MRLRAGPGLQDDRAAVPGRPRRLVKNKPWDFFMLVRDRARPPPPRVLAVLRPAPPALRGRATSTRARSRTTTGSWTREVGSLLEMLPDDAVTIVMSDHGARPMMGGLLLQRLADAGGLPGAHGDRVDAGQRRSRRRRSTGAARSPGATAATTAGCFLNVKGREPQGVDRARAVRGRPRRAGREARGGTRPRRRTARHEGVQAAGRLSGGPRRGARPASSTSATWDGARSARSATRASTPTRTTPGRTVPTTIARASSP